MRRQRLASRGRGALEESGAHLNSCAPRYPRPCFPSPQPSPRGRGRIVRPPPRPREIPVGRESECVAPSPRGEGWGEGKGPCTKAGVLKMWVTSRPGAAAEKVI